MSNYSQLTKHPESGKIEMAMWLDDYFGKHQYGVEFADGKVFHENRIERITLMPGQKNPPIKGDKVR